MKIKKILYVLVIVIGFFVARRTYNYFFNVTPPSIEIVGLDLNGCYKGTIASLLKAQDSYKVGAICLLLDNKPFAEMKDINTSQFEQEIPIQTKQLSDGEHTLKIEAVDASYARNKTIKEISFIVDNTPLQAAVIRPTSDAQVPQGRTLHLQVQANKPLKNVVANVLSQEYHCFPESNKSNIYECYVPIDCEEKPQEYLFSVQAEDVVGNTVVLENKMQVAKYPFKKQVLAINAEKREKEKEVGLPQKQLEDTLRELCEQSATEKLWHGNFYAPIDITRITTEFGTVRTTQEKGRYMHKAVDVINAPKSVVWAPQRGKVIVKDRFVESGNTVVLDHGYGIFSLLYHLDSFADIKVGDVIRQGNPVGTLGKTGYATGYHLHWEMRINNTHVDPMQWVKPVV